MALLHRSGVDLEVFELLEESGRNVERAALLLRDLLVDYPERADLARDLVLCEHEGDRIAHDILPRAQQHSSRRAAPEPADVHALTGALDDIVDFSEEAADQLGRYGVEASMEAAQEIADVLVRCAREIVEALRGLCEGVDAAAHRVEIHRLENEADRIVREAVGSLFVNGIDPMVVIRWKDIFESLEAAVDACETAANVLEGIALKRGLRVFRYLTVNASASSQRA
jgi:uncharacterized protein Yka (UPF0111/DUF47 family)